MGSEWYQHPYLAQPQEAQREGRVGHLQGLEGASEEESEDNAMKL